MPKFSEILLHVAKHCKLFGNFLTRNWDCRAVQRSALCRSRRELSNAYFLAKFGFDTAENEPCQVCVMATRSMLPRCRATHTTSRRFERYIGAATDAEDASKSPNAWRVFFEWRSDLGLQLRQRGVVWFDLRRELLLVHRVRPGAIAAFMVLKWTCSKFFTW